MLQKMDLKIRRLGSKIYFPIENVNMENEKGTSHNFSLKI